MNFFSGFIKLDKSRTVLEKWAWLQLMNKQTRDSCLLGSFFNFIHINRAEHYILELVRQIMENWGHN
jgi:hypothetical protein